MLLLLVAALGLSIGNLEQHNGPVVGRAVSLVDAEKSDALELNERALGHGAQARVDDGAALDARVLVEVVLELVAFLELVLADEVAKVYD